MAMMRVEVCRILIQGVIVTHFRYPDLKLLLGLPNCLHGTGWTTCLHGAGLYVHIICYSNMHFVQHRKSSRYVVAQLLV